MREKFTELRLSKSNKVRLETVNDILEQYEDEGFVLTLRQLYYQLVSRDIIPNNDKEYSKLSVLLTQGRMAGVVDWSSIEDRVRKPKIPYFVHDIKDAIDDTISQYRLDRMRGQNQKIEVWVEKDALSNVLYKVTKKYHVRLMVNRGYSSISAMYDAYKRLSDGDVILYFGDHDPSGIDMIRDVKERLMKFGLEINVVPVALTMKQIKMYNPPPNPAKITDTRAKEYISNYGDMSWELDALPPKSLMKLAEDTIKDYIDMDLYDAMIQQEADDINKLKSILK